jgi:hypothetical protein
LFHNEITKKVTVQHGPEIAGFVFVSSFLLGLFTYVQIYYYAFFYLVKNDTEDGLCFAKVNKQEAILEIPYFFSGVIKKTQMIEKIVCL